MEEVLWEIEMNVEEAKRLDKKVDRFLGCIVVTSLKIGLVLCFLKVVYCLVKYWINNV